VVAIDDIDWTIGNNNNTPPQVEDEAAVLMVLPDNKVDEEEAEDHNYDETIDLKYETNTES
jgi:hypothetical protein